MNFDSKVRSSFIVIEKSSSVGERQLFSKKIEYLHVKFVVKHKEADKGDFIIKGKVGRTEG